MSWKAMTKIELTEMHCNGCGGVYAMDEEVRAQRKKDGKNWNCPYCGPRCYRESDADILRKELEIKNKIATNAMEQAAKAKKEKKKILQRINNGVCPHCNRYFKNLHRHMQTKHKKVSDVQSDKDKG